MIQAFSHIFNFFNVASPCGDMIFNGKVSLFVRLNMNAFWT
jgi:hypothetical protein